MKVKLILLDRTNPSYPPPKEIFKSVRKTLVKNDFTNYSETKGIPQLRIALVKKLYSVNHINVDQEQILITIGSSTALLLAIILSTRKKGFVLCPNPFYPPYGRLIKALGLKVLYYSLTEQNNFIPSLKRIKYLIKSHKISTMIINSPSNPTSIVLPIDLVKEIVDLSHRYGFDLISDEAYENFVYEGSYISVGSLNKAENTFSIFSFSKTYAMSGWRLGYIVIPKKVIKDAERLYRAMVINTPLFSQMAGLAAMANTNFPQEIYNNFLNQRNDAAKILNKYNIHFSIPQGGLCFWININSTKLSSIRFTELCLTKANLIIQPGTIFGSEGKDYIRVSFSGPKLETFEGMRRLGIIYNKFYKKE